MTESFTEKKASLRDAIAERYAGHGRYFRGAYHDEGLAAVAELSATFPFRKTELMRDYHPHDAYRYVLVGDQFKSYLSGRILDVGSRENVIKKVLGIDAELVDKNSASVAPIDLEQAQLPYADGAFDTVVCLDTLEHIDRLHECFDELLRVTNKTLIISLPNCWRKTFRQMLRGWSSQQAYGLPPEKPMDRHKWFFNSEEIEQFFFYRSVSSEGAPRYVVREVRQHILPPGSSVLKLLYPVLRVCLPERTVKNLFVNTTFVVLEKV